MQVTVRHIPARLDAETSAAIRLFCLGIIRQTYGIGYTPAWHADLDSLMLAEADGWFSRCNGGSLYLAQAADGTILGTGGLYGLSRKRATAERLAQRYADPARVCQIARVYLAPAARRKGLGRQIAGLLEADARRLGYRTSYLHADAQALVAQDFWHRCGYRAFGRFSYPAAEGEDTSVDFDKPLV